MRKLLALILFAILCLVATGITVFAKTNLLSNSVNSPLPKNLEVLGAKNTPFLASEDIWLPKDNITKSGPVPTPQVAAASVYMIDLTTDEVLYAKNVHERRPVASLVKIMTALVSLERAEKDAKYLVSEKSTSVGEDSMGVTAGERLTYEELLYGLMLPSGNDAAETIAEGVGGTHELFVDMMNGKAKQLGLKDSQFVNPTGLDGDGEHFSSAYDMAVIARTAYKKYPLFRKVVGTYEYHLPYSDEHKELWLYNQTSLLTTYPGALGIKPGYTPDAGLCIVTLAENGGHQILAVLLNGEDRRAEMIALLDYAFAVQGVTLPAH